MSASKIIRLALIGSLALGALAACGDDNDAQRLPKRTATPSPTTTQDLEASAEAFVREYIRASHEALHTADPSGLERYHAPDCKPCQFNVDVVKDFRSKGQHVEGYASLVSQVEGAVSETTALVSVVGHHEAGKVVQSDGSSVKNLPATSDVNSTFSLVRVAGGWLITDVESHGPVQQ